MGEITVDTKGVLKLLNNLKIHKAPGPDGLGVTVVKECSSEIASILALLYKESQYQMISDKQRYLRFITRGRNMMLLIIDRCRLLTSVAKHWSILK